MKIKVSQITKEQIDAAIASDILEEINKQYASRDYDLLYEEQRIPVKNVFRAVYVLEGGEGKVGDIELNSTQAKKRLIKLGYEVLDKEILFFTNADLVLLKESSGKKYDKNNPDDFKRKEALKSVYSKVEFWAREVISRLSAGFSLKIRKSPTNQSNVFEKYMWAKLYPSKKDLSDQWLAFTVGINEDGKFNMKIDTVYLKPKDERQLRYEEVRGDIYDSGIVDFKSLSNFTDWESLVQHTTSFINDRLKNYHALKGEFQTEEVVVSESAAKTSVYYEGPLNQILYGPPGTGKTRKTVQIAAKIVANTEGNHYEKSLEIFNNNLHDTIEFITFHQNYSYEDFVQGLRPVTEANNGQLSFTVNDGIFKVMADKALQNYKDSQGGKSSKRPFEDVLEDLQSELIDSENGVINIPMKRVSYDITDIGSVGISFRKASGGTGHTLSLNTLKRYYNQEFVETKEGGLSIYYQPLVERMLDAGKDKTSKRIELQNYVLIIDEINRANISRVFGELITLIEKDKRYDGTLALSCTLPSGHILTIPPNLYIIGTMNTADKSIALLDVALRRRFEFIPMYPGVDVDSDLINHYDIFTSINEQIKKDKSPDFMIGHSYFMTNGDDDFDLNSALKNKVVPLLLEYYMNNEKRVTQILENSGLTVDNNTFPMTVTYKKS